MTTRTPVQVVDRALELLLAHDMAGFAGLWAPEGTMEFPLAGPGRPRDYTDAVDPRSVPERTDHLTADPEVIVVEFAVEGLVVATGQPYRMPYIAVITVRDGAIVSYRDYWSLAAADGAFDGFGIASGAAR